MTAVLIVLLVVIVAALIVWSLPRLRGRAAGRRLRPRRGRIARQRRIAPPPDQTGSPAHVPDDEELRMRAQAHREAAARNQREAAEIERGREPVAPPAATPSAAPPPAAPPPAAPPAATPYDERY